MWRGEVVLPTVRGAGEGAGMSMVGRRWVVAGRLEGDGGWRWGASRHVGVRGHVRRRWVAVMCMCRVVRATTHPHGVVCGWLLVALLRPNERSSPPPKA